MDTINSVGIFKDKRFLLIEDDEILIDKLGRIFSDNNLRELVVKSYYNEALEELKSDQEYDLIIFDIMLPISKKDFENTKSLKAELLKHIKKIIQVEDEGSINNPDVKFELEQARDRRTMISQEINAYIDQEGGVKLITDWRSQNKNDKYPPLLAITAIGPDEFIKIQERINKLMKFKNVEFLAKPSTAEKIIKVIQGLLKN